MDMRISRATAVVVQKVPAAGVKWFMEWQGGITSAAETYAGYRGTEVYPPSDGGEGEWVAVVSFETQEFLRAWLD